LLQSLLGLELEVESLREPVQLDLSLGEEPVRSRGGLPRSQGEGGGEHSLCQVASKVPSLEHRQLVGRVERVDEWRLGDGIVIILILILLGFSHFILQLCLGRGLASTGDMSSFKDPESIDPGGILDGDGLALIINIAVLSNPLVVSS